MKVNDIKKRIDPRRIVVLIVFLSLLAWAIAWANSGWEGYTITEDSGVEYETARVLDILKDDTQRDPSIEGRLRGKQILEVEILTGRYAGDVVQTENYFSAMYNVEVDLQDTISVRIDTNGVGEYQVSVYNYNRIPAIFALLALFGLSVILIGGWQGLRALVGLIFTFVCIVWLLLPMALKGIPTVPVTIVLVGVTSTICFYLLGGWQPKMVGAAIGCICGIAAAAILGYFAAHLVHASAYQMEEAEGLILARGDYGLKLNGLLLSGILIAAEGAVMDTAMSVASAMAELKQKRPDIARGELFRSGMRVGRDATGTMANTLVLAFAGSSLNMMVLIYSYQVSFTQLMNTDFVATELVRSIAGSMGILWTVPCVSAVTAWLLSKQKKVSNK